MNRLKKALAIALSVAVMIPSTSFAAYKNSVGINLTDDKAQVVTEYTGNAQQPLTITIGEYTLVEGKDFQIVGTKPTSVGTHTLKIEGIGTCKGTATVTYTIKKAAKPVVTVAKKDQKKLNNLTTEKLEKKSKTIKIKSTGKITKIKAKGKKAKKWIKVGKNGKITLKKGIKKGTYKIRVTVKGTKDFKKGTKTVKIVVK